MSIEKKSLKDNTFVNRGENSHSNLISSPRDTSHSYSMHINLSFNKHNVNKNKTIFKGSQTNIHIEEPINRINIKGGMRNTCEECSIPKKKYVVEKINVMNFVNQFAEKYLKIVKHDGFEVLSIRREFMIQSSLNFQILKKNEKPKLEIQNQIPLQILVENNLKFQNSEEEEKIKKSNTLLIKHIPDNQIKQETKIIQKTDDVIKASNFISTPLLNSEINEKKDEIAFNNNNTNESNCQTENNLLSNQNEFQPKFNNSGTNLNQNNNLPLYHSNQSNTVFNTYIPQNYGITDNQASLNNINKFSFNNINNFPKNHVTNNNTINYTNSLKSNSLVDNRYKNDSYNNDYIDCQMETVGMQYDENIDYRNLKEQTLNQKHQPSNIYHVVNEMNNRTINNIGNMNIHDNVFQQVNTKADPLIKTFNNNPFALKENKSNSQPQQTFQFNKPQFNMSNTNNTFYPANNGNDKNKYSGLLADYQSQTKDYRYQKRNYNF